MQIVNTMVTDIQNVAFHIFIGYLIDQKYIHILIDYIKNNINIFCVNASAAIAWPVFFTLTLYYMSERKIG